MSYKEANSDVKKSGAKSKRTIKKKANKTQMNFSFVLALVTLLLIFAYFIQSFVHIRNQGVLVIAIDRLQNKDESTEPKD